MAYLLILVVLAVAIAPLVQLLPGKRQRKVARLRECAALSGLFVEFRDMPSGAVASGLPRDVIYYGKRLPKSRSATSEARAWIESTDGWRSVGSREPVPHQLSGLNVDILAASVDEFSCGVYWTESAEEEAVVEIKQFLEDWIVDLPS